MTVYKVFKQGSWTNIEKEINVFLKDNPNLDLKQIEEEDNSSNVIVHCVFEEKKKEKENLTEELLEGLIGAVNELTDAVKTLTEKNRKYNLKI